MSMINITLAPPPSSNDPIRRHVNLREAARILGVSQSTIRRAARRAGVQKIAGRTVRGAIVISGIVQFGGGPSEMSRVPLAICYSA